jgi:hypothetical protein
LCTSYYTINIIELLGNYILDSLEKEKPMNQAPLIEKLYAAEPEQRVAIIAIHSADARDVIRQLAARPRWDGDLNSKYGRDQLVDLGWAARWNGVNFLTATGFAVVDAIWGLQGIVKE